MAKLAQCPGPNELQQLAAGAVPTPRLDALAAHLEACPACLAKVQAIAPNDTLVDCLTKARTLVDGPDAAAIARLIGKLKQLPAAGATVAFACPQCRKTLRTRAEMAGKKSKCPGCGHAVVVPAPAASPATVSLAPTTAGEPAPRAGEEEAWDFLAPSQAADEIGRLGPYRILKVLGRGGMGVVFRAEDPSLKRIVALKAMLPTLAASPSAKKRFLREAQTAASIKHDHIVTIHQVGEDRGAPYLAMEFLHGEPLDARLKRDGALPVAEVLRIGAEMADGLAAAHDAGLIHRDIKPANVWLEDAPARRSAAGATPAPDARRPARVKILDFGLARATDDQANLTQSGAIIGTPAFMAPEQAQGKPVDGRCDLFSLGCVLYAMTTGRPPFKGTDTISTLMSVATDSPAPPQDINPTVPPELSDFILQLLAKNPADRPESAHEAAAALQALQAALDAHGSGGTQLMSRPPVRPSAARRSGRRWLIAGGLAGALAAVLLLAGVVFFLQTPTGTVRIEINDPQIEAVLTKTGAVVKGADKHDITASVGEHGLRIKRGDFTFDTDKFVLHKGETVVLRVEFLQGKVAVTRADGTVLGAAPPPATGGTATAPPTGGTATSWKPTAEQQEYLDFVAKLPAGERTASIVRKLKELNKASEAAPVFEPPTGPPTACRLTDRLTGEVWPLAALPTLRTLDLSAAGVLDLTPLVRLPLTDLKVNLVLDNVRNEAAFKGMATLKTVNGRPAAEFWAERAELRAEIDRMAARQTPLSLGDRVGWFGPLMKKLNPECTAGFTTGIEPAENQMRLYVYEGRTECVAQLGGGKVFDFSPVRGLAADSFAVHGGMLFDLTPLARTRIQRCTIYHVKLVRDLAPLAGLPLIRFTCVGTQVHDLRPLAGMKLTAVGVALSPIADLAVLKGMPLDSVDVDNTAVSDLAPLAGAPLKLLRAHGTRITSIAPLRGMALEGLEISQTPGVGDLSPLRGMPLRTLGAAPRLYFEPDERMFREMKLLVNIVHSPRRSSGRCSPSNARKFRTSWTRRRSCRRRKRPRPWPPSSRSGGCNPRSSRLWTGPSWKRSIRT